MRKLFVMVVVAALAIGLVLVAGCSDDDNGTGPGDGNALNPEDSTFVEDFLGSEEIFGTTLESAEISLALLDSIPAPAMPRAVSGLKALSRQGDEFIITSAGYQGYTNGWHVFQLTAIIIDNYDTVDVVGIDSVQVLENGQPVEFPDEQTEIDGLKERVHVDWDERQGTGHGDMNHSTDIDLAIIEIDTIITINGSVHDTLQTAEEWTAQEAWCEAELTLDQTITNVQLELGMAEGDCPLDGHVISTASIDVICISESQTGLDTLTIAGTWTVTATVNDNNTITITFSNGTVSWTITEPCNGGTLTSPLRRTFLRSF